jgi:capsular polysaccharide transport system permease protein
MVNATPDLTRLRPVSRQRRLSTLRTVSALMLREMTTTYGRSPGGYLWAILEPVLGIVIIAAAFSFFLRAPPLGTNFQLFDATGLLPLMVFNKISTSVATALRYSQNLLTYPRVTMMDALLARFILNTLTQILVGYIVLLGIILYFDITIALDAPRLLLALTMVISLAAGIGLLNCFLFGVFPIWRSVWKIIQRPLLLVSGVLLLYDQTPEPWRSWLWYNPIVHLVGEMRAAFYPRYTADYVSPAYVFGVALVSGVIGLLFLWRYHRDILER